jgi:hypothetical protein
MLGQDTDHQPKHSSAGFSCPGKHVRIPDNGSSIREYLCRELSSKCQAESGEYTVSQERVRSLSRRVNIS